jgi:hypothetical protein
MLNVNMLHSKNAFVMLMAFENPKRAGNPDYARQSCFMPDRQAM